MDGRQQVDDLLALSAEADDNQQILGLYGADISMQRLGRMQEHGRRAQGRESCCNLSCNMPGLSHAADNDLSPAGQKQIQSR
ncbi:hypothetical protein SDC9_96062 [bioreactor metagenome]|uniref:Uncharacterized protein n=1 Tax=bioreactor metagenome TaxID=1076179 RepID=A0A645AER3_9ZZZZ